jgi:DHA1 family bicyclomycin/chloramphenicol resistance-like MFS transporter
MEHMAPIAGTAASVQGVIGTLGAAIIGFFIGQQFDGTATPYLVGTAICAALGFTAIALTEPEKLFAPIRIDTAEKIAPESCIPEDLG